MAWAENDVYHWGSFGGHQMLDLIPYVIENHSIAWGFRSKPTISTTSTSDLLKEDCSHLLIKLSEDWE